MAGHTTTAGPNGGTGGMDLVGRLISRISFGALLVLVAVLVYLLALDPSGYEIGVDYHLYRSVAERWLAGGSFYQSWQLAGPYPIHGGPGGAVLYPPIVLVLLVPFVYLPAFLWWVVPMTATAYGLWRLRPASWVWPVVLILALVPTTPGLWLWGNPGMWMLAGETLGFTFGWPAVLVLMKPTLAPFALAGVRHRSWWLGLALFVALCVPFGAMWSGWWRAVIVNPTNGGLSYSLAYLPVSLIPLIAYIARRPTSVSTVSGFTVGRKA